MNTQHPLAGIGLPTLDPTLDPAIAHKLLSTIANAGPAGSGQESPKPCLLDISEVRTHYEEIEWQLIQLRGLYTALELIGETISPNMPPRHPLLNARAVVENLVGEKIVAIQQIHERQWSEMRAARVSA